MEVTWHVWQHIAVQIRTIIIIITGHDFVDNNDNYNKENDNSNSRPPSFYSSH